jgi:CRISPR-associated protein Csd1
MILQALNSYYQRLEHDPDVDIAPFGFSRQKIAFCVMLNADGSLHEIADVRTQEGKKLLPLSLIVLGNAKPSGAGINPCFLWDNPAYLLGYKADDPKPERTRNSFEAFRERHRDVESNIDDPEFSAVCTFLRQWNPDEAQQHEKLVEIGTGFGVFRIRATDHYVHEREAVKTWWRGQFEDESDTSDAVNGQCLVTGEQRPLARLHEPKIKGVWGAQSAGALLVSFNDSAYESYGREGKKAGRNAPVSEQSAFQYCTALNRLLADNRRRIQIGDASTVFWTEKPTEAENLLPWTFDPSRDAEDEALTNHVHAVLSQISQGKYPGEFGDPTTPFYVLGLSPNAARISVRFWRVSTLGDLVDNLRQHFVDLAIIRSDRDPEFPSVWRLLRETVRDSKDLPPLLGGAVMQAILSGTPYPSLMYTSLIRRIRADRQVRYLRAATIKAYLNRNTRSGIQPLEKELDMSLDADRTEPGYRLGRLFAELEKTQEDAQPGINDTIKDRYFGSASATPGSVFPRIIRLSQHHLGKLEKGSRTYHEKRIQAIVAELVNFPSHLSLRDQGLFAIGYYHQRQDIFTKKSDNTNSATQEQE